MMLEGVVSVTSHKGSKKVLFVVKRAREKGRRIRGWDRECFMESY